jgi:membrane protease YdiL (CAAX protease family)
MIIRIVVFYVLTWFFLVLLGGGQQAVGLLPAEIGLAQWAPGIAALFMLLIFRKDQHKIVFFAPGTPARRYGLAILIPLALSLVVWGISRFIPQEMVTPPLYDSLWLIVLWAPLGALGEEIGWRGYLHKMLNPRLRGLYSSILVGILWFPIHVHFLSAGLLFAFFFALLIVAYSVIIYALVQATGFSVALATLFHLAINLTNLLYLDRLFETPFMIMNALVWALAATVVVWAKWDLFGRRR